MKLPAFLLCVLAASSAFAQNSPPNGFWKLVKASQLRIPGPTGSISSGLFFPPAENLRRERLVVKRDAPALKMMREALKMPYSIPPGAGDGLVSNSKTPPLYRLGKIREFARLFIQESDVRYADRDYPGAVNSRLDCMQMGVRISNGAFIPMMSGLGIESSGTSDLEKFASRITASQCLQAQQRLIEMDTQRPSFAHIVRLEGQGTLRTSFDSLKFNQKNLKTFNEDSYSENFTRRDAIEISTLKPEVVRRDNARLFNAAIGAAKLPYQKARKAVFPTDLEYFSRSSLSILSNPSFRAIYERQVAQNRALQCAFELRAIKLKTGSYPFSFKTPVDPFSTDLKPMIYRRVGKGYRLYSVGPDGKDNGGYAPTILRETTDPNTGKTIKIRSKARLFAGGIGDIVAPVFQ